MVEFPAAKMVHQGSMAQKTIPLELGEGRSSQWNSEIVKGSCKHQAPMGKKAVWRGVSQACPAGLLRSGCWNSVLNTWRYGTSSHLPSLLQNRSSCMMVL